MQQGGFGGFLPSWTFSTALAAVEADAGKVREPFLSIRDGRPYCYPIHFHLALRYHRPTLTALLFQSQRCRLFLI